MPLTERRLVVSKIHQLPPPINALLLIRVWPAKDKIWENCEKKTTCRSHPAAGLTRPAGRQRFKGGRQKGNCQNWNQIPQLVVSKCTLFLMGKQIYQNGNRYRISCDNCKRRSISSSWWTRPRLITLSTKHVGTLILFTRICRLISNNHRHRRFSIRHVG